MQIERASSASPPADESASKRLPMVRWRTPRLNEDLLELASRLSSRAPREHIYYDREWVTTNLRSPQPAEAASPPVAAPQVSSIARQTAADLIIAARRSGSAQDYCRAYGIAGGAWDLMRDEAVHPARRGADHSIEALREMQARCPDAVEQVQLHLKAARGEFQAEPELRRRAQRRHYQRAAGMVRNELYTPSVSAARKPFLMSCLVEAHTGLVHVAPEAEQRKHACIADEYAAKLARLEHTGNGTFTFAALPATGEIQFWRQWAAAAQKSPAASPAASQSGAGAPSMHDEFAFSPRAL